MVSMAIMLLAFQTVMSGNVTDENILIATPVTEDSFLSEWKCHPAELRFEYDAAAGEPVLSLFVEAKPEAKPEWNRVYKSVSAAPGQRFEAVVLVEGDTAGGNGPTVTVSFLDAANKRIAHTDMFLGNGATGKRSVKLWAEAPQDTAQVQLSLLLHGFGETHFSGISLVRLADVSAPPDSNGVKITVTEDMTTALIGAGFEDDGWFYNPDNAARGADEAAIKIREERITWMEPDYVRMFFWYRDWNPSLDAATFTWDSDNMLSHYRTLDLYQRLGARVNVCGVEWGVKDPWENPEQLARTIGALLEHLIVEKGYTCIRDYTLTNEPDIFFARSVERQAQSFDTYVKLHRCVKNEFAQRGLSLNIVGSDDGNNRTWFERCVGSDDYFAQCDLFASHFYFPINVVPMAHHILSDRVGLLRDRDPQKEFIIGEMGFADARMQPPDINPLMGEYPYALLAMSVFTDALNAGVAGWSIWCVHEMYYPGGRTPMRFGLWDFDPPTWPVRPIYHALTLMTRNSKAGDMVYRCESSHPDWLKAARIGNKLFWVNLGEADTPLTIDGKMQVRKVTAMMEANLTHDRDCSRSLEIASGRSFVAPAKSFGMAVMALQK